MSRNANKHRAIIGVLLGVVLLGGVASLLMSGGKTTRKAAPKQEVITITLPPPPPPPPPPKIEPPEPKEEPPPDEDQIVEEEPIDVNEEPPEAPPEAPSEDLGTNITGGNGPDMGLTRGGGSGRIGGGGGGGGRGSVFNRYGRGAVQSIEAALRNDPATRSAAIGGLRLEFWPAADGSIRRVSFGSTGDPALDQAIRRVLTGLRTTPPSNASELPGSMTIRISARRPSNS